MPCFWYVHCPIMNSTITPTLNLKAQHAERRVVVTGASGYVGARLVVELLSTGFNVRATSRSLSSLKRFPWYDQVEAVEADLSISEDVNRLFEDVDTVFYLVHSMSGTQNFEELESKIASKVAQAAHSNGVRQIIYLSGLHPRTELDKLSPHMRSRENVARILGSTAVPAITFRAATLIGSGSASFEMIRHLTERLPIMVAPQWINNKIEPISIRDTLYYLVKAADLPEPINEEFDIGSGHIYTFADLLRIYGKIRGLRRTIVSLPIPLPFDTLSGLWIAAITPAPLSLAQPLAQSMQEDAICNNRSIRDYIPDPPSGLADYPTSVRRALQQESMGVLSSWDSSWKNLSSTDHLPSDPEWTGRTVYSDVQEQSFRSEPAKVWRVIEGIGGHHGWYSTPLLWFVRGVIDKAIGGPGLGGRRDPNRLRVGDRVDFWRVEEVTPEKQLTLRAEMRASGQAWLQFTINGNKLRQRAVYFPKGLLGRVYWLALIPFHAVIFPTMLRNIIQAGDN